MPRLSRASTIWNLPPRPARYLRSRGRSRDPASAQCSHLLDRGCSVGRVGICHRLHDDRNLPAHANVANLDGRGLSALDIWHGVLCSSLPVSPCTIRFPARDWDAAGLPESERFRGLCSCFQLTWKGDFVLGKYRFAGTVPDAANAETVWHRIDASGYNCHHVVQS